MTGEPPSLSGAVHSREAEAFPAVTISNLGTPGTEPGVTYSDHAVLDESPAAFAALTRNRYWVPFVRPEQVAAVPVTVHEALGDAMMV